MARRKKRWKVGRRGGGVRVRARRRRGLFQDEGGGRIDVDDAQRGRQNSLETDRDVDL